MSEGCLLRALVRGLMNDEFLQSSELADALRPLFVRFIGVSWVAERALCRLFHSELFLSPRRVHDADFGTSDPG